MAATSPKPRSPLAQRAFGGTPDPAPGETWLVSVDGDLRPFLVVLVTQGQAGGWVFHAPHLDMHSDFLRSRGFSVEDRRHPCYCVVPVAALAPVKGRPR